MEPVYSPPYPLSKLPKHLVNDPVHRWRATTGIELIHEEPTYEEFERIPNNWNLMPDSMKKQSDAKYQQKQIEEALDIILGNIEEGEEK